MNRVPIDSVPGKMGGKTCIAGTRMPVDDLFIHLAQGGSIHSFIKDHDWLKPEQLKAVLQFAADDMVNDRGAVERARVAAGLAEDPRRTTTSSTGRVIH